MRKVCLKGAAMTFDEAERILYGFAVISEEGQRSRKDELIIAFDVFWASNPSRAKFGQVCAGLVMLPEMLWTMAKVS